MGILQFFNSKDKTFVPLFVSVTLNLIELSELLKKIIEAPPGEREELARQAQTLDAKGEKMLRSIIKELGKNFITPFDREDIHDLETAIGSSQDFIHGSLKRIYLYQVMAMDSHFVELCDQIILGVAELQKACELLISMSNAAAIKAICQNIKKIELEADGIYDRATTSLFQQEKDPIELMKKKDILESLETATDKIDEAANIIRSILIKYA
ncbi:MAG: DUF47 family protein [Bacteroidia bacterium]|nr:DUF47 family protein [Bacteroidia bacterium]